MTLGAGLGIDDPNAVARLEAACDRLGLDLVSGGNVLAWAIRAGQAGHVDTPLGFGDPAGADALVSAAAIGDYTVEAAAEQYGGHGLIPSVKGLELPNYDPRAAPSMALAYATSDRGACHRRALPIEREPFEGEWAPAEAAAAVIEEQNRRAAQWCLIVDDFAVAAIEDRGAKWLAALNHPADGAALESLGERVWTLTRLFNVREGWRRADDTLPPVLTEGLVEGREADGIDETRFDAMLEAYYAGRDWGPDGRPTQALVEQLGLAAVVDDDTLLADGRASTPGGS
jgi:aldehyde:ferredoxin oxidoreductase